VRQPRLRGQGRGSGGEAIGGRGMSDLNWILLTVWLIPITVFLGKLVALALDSIGDGVYVSPFPSEYETLYSDEKMYDRVFKLIETANKYISEITVNGFINEVDVRVFSDSLLELCEFLFYRNKPVPKYLIKRIRILIKFNDYLIALNEKTGDDNQGMGAAVDCEPANKEA
jgi:hypothetical protein